jgi:hypothetical protein
MLDARKGKLEDLIRELGAPERLSTKKDVAIYSTKKSLLRIPNRVYITGYVKSDSRPLYFHSVAITYIPGKRTANRGECSCESFEYRGFPCKHAVKMKDAYVAWLAIERKNR